MLRLSSLFVLALGFVLVGCGDESAGPDGGLSSDPFAMWTSTGDATYGEFHITSQWNVRSNVPNYRSGGEVYSSSTGHNPSLLVSGGAMVASNLPISERYPGAYEDLRGANGPTFGAKTAWSLSGNAGAGIPGFTDSMYVPAEIRITGPSAATLGISKSQPLTITWNQDSNNDAVLIIVDYMVDESLMRDSTLTTTDYRWKTITDDDGSYTVSISDLASLPVGGLVQVTLARGVSKKSGTGTHPFFIYAYSMADAIYAVGQ